MSDKKQKGGVIKIIAVVGILAIVFVIANQLGLIGRLKDVEVMQGWFQGLGFIGCSRIPFDFDYA